MFQYQKKEAVRCRSRRKYGHKTSKDSMLEQIIFRISCLLHVRYNTLPLPHRLLRTE